jgi:ABC-type branched-subunit amino acid transport system permease subunit
LIVTALNVMLAIGLDFILGYAGQLNLGHCAFYGIGAYASTLLIMNPWWYVGNGVGNADFMGIDASSRKRRPSVSVRCP